jgi:hypothetical protein
MQDLIIDLLAWSRAGTDESKPVDFDLSVPLKTVLDTFVFLIKEIM